MCHKTVTVKWKKIHQDAVIPSYVHEGDAGFDFTSIEDVVLTPYERKIVKTGLKVEIPPGYEMQIRPRSGISLKTPVLIANAPGTIDSGYRGEVGIIVLNNSSSEYKIEKGERIAQGVIKEVIPVIHIEADELSETMRGEGGFGSTEKNN